MPQSPTNGPNNSDGTAATDGSPPPCPKTYTVDLVVGKTPLTLKHDNQGKLEITVTPGGAPVTEYKIEMKRPTGGWCVLAKKQTLDPWTARIAGTFKVRGCATIYGKEQHSPEKDVVVQFPTYDEIVGDGDVQSKTDAEWTATLASCTSNPNERREHGFWIRLNTKSDKYEFTSTVVSDPSPPEAGAAVDIGSRPSDSPADPKPCDEGAIYSVASFHTHTPTEFRTGVPSLQGWDRPIGPSDADMKIDKSDDVPGVVYDYIESPAGSGSIPMGHPKGSAAKRYQSLGKVRRTTPP